MAEHEMKDCCSKAYDEGVKRGYESGKAAAGKKPGTGELDEAKREGLREARGLIEEILNIIDEKIGDRE